MMRPETSWPSSASYAFGLRTRLRFPMILLLLTLLSLGSCGSPALRTTPLGIGDALYTNIALEDVGTPPTTVGVDSLLGGKPTVFYAWSVPCPCIANAEARIQALIERYGDSVRWVAIAGEPLDTVEQLREQRLRFGSPYPVLRDPEQRLCRLLRLDSAAQIAVLTGDRKLAYRGPMDDDFVDGTGQFLAEVLDALADGRAVPHPERPRSYGCFFNDPGSCRKPEGEGG